MLNLVIYASIPTRNDESTGVCLHDAIHVLQYAKYTLDVNQESVFLHTDKHPSA